MIIGYVRRSRASSKPALRLASQRREILARFPDADVRVELRTAVHGKRRPVLEEITSTLRAGDQLVVARLDRLSRSVEDAARLIRTARKRGYNIVALDFGLDLASANGELVANVLVSVAQWEARVMGERISEAIAEKQRTGWKHVRTRAVEQRQPEVRRLAAGGLSQRAISRATGLHRATVARLLT